MVVPKRGSADEAPWTGAVQLCLREADMKDMCDLTFRSYHQELLLD